MTDSRPENMGAPAALEPLGDRAFLARFATEREAGEWTAAVRAASFPDVTDVVLAYCSAAVFADPERADLGDLERRLRAVSPLLGHQPRGKLVEIPVLYEGEDLKEVAARLNLNPAEVIALHSGTDYDVFAVGFLPGFPYAGYLCPELSGLPRRDEPRVRVPAGSVAIAGRQTGIYPRESPGGWHLIGTTPLQIADPDAGHFPIRAGDRIRFQPISPDAFEARQHDRL